MSFFEKDFLERVKSSKASGVSKQDLKCTSKTVSPQQMARLDFGEPIAPPRAQPSCDNCPNPELVSEAPTLELQGPSIVLESPENIPTALPAPSPIPLAAHSGKLCFMVRAMRLSRLGMLTQPCAWSAMSYRPIAAERTLPEPFELARCASCSQSASEQKSGML